MSRVSSLTPVQLAHVKIHVAVILFGFTAILGAFIELNAMVLVWWRLLLTCTSLLFLTKVVQTFRALDPGSRQRMIGVGILVALHWITFFGSIKLANASVALVCYSTTALFTALLEPFFSGRRWQKLDLLLGAIMIPGMILVTQGVQVDMIDGVIVGLLSALFIALLTLFNKQLVEQHEPLFITFVELGAGWLMISFLALPYLIWQQGFSSVMPAASDWVYLIILALICTTVGYVLQLSALKEISAFTSSLTMNLEPVYGVFLAIAILHENRELSLRFYCGVVIILLAVFIYPLLQRAYVKRS